MSDLATVIDALRGVLEPAPAVGFTLDDTLAEPPTYLPETLYAWPLREAFIEDGVDLDRHEFTIRVAYSADRKGEVDLGTRDRSVSLAVHAKVQAYRTNVRTHRARTDELWSDLHVDAVDYDRLRALEVRGFLMDIAGWSFAE